MLTLFRRFSSKPSTRSTRIGFIGLGMMGGKMVENFKNDGHELIVFDKNQESVKAVMDDDKVLGAVEYLIDYLRQG